MATAASELLLPGAIIKERFKIVQKVGKGGFGEVYQAEDLETNEQVAVKAVSIKHPKRLLRMEAAVLKKTKYNQHFCRFIRYGHMPHFNYLAMQLQGKNLSDLRREQPRCTFSLSTTLLLGLQMLKALEELHSHGYMHCDVKPSNFSIGLPPYANRIVYILDFGLAYLHTDEDGEPSCPCIESGFHGSVRYASLNVHHHKELGRNDDLWSLFYAIAEFANGQLPWRKIKELEKVKAAKENCDYCKLLTRFPSSFKQFLEHIQELTWNEQPNYALLTRILKICMRKRGIQETDPYDWEMVDDEL